MISAGVRFFNGDGVGVATLTLTDRCTVERDDVYLCQLPQRKMERFIENGSQIVVELENHRECPVVRFRHYRHGKLVNKKRAHFCVEGLAQDEECYAKVWCHGESVQNLWRSRGFESVFKRVWSEHAEREYVESTRDRLCVRTVQMFIEQFYGRGSYSIRETRKSRRDLSLRRESKTKKKRQSKGKLEQQRSPRTGVSVVDVNSPSTASSARRTIGGRIGYRRSI